VRLVYEAFYLLRTRPFGLDAGAGGCWVTPEVGQSLQHAVACLQNGAEVVVVTGPAGSGKSTVCQELAQRLSDRLRPVLLPHCEFAGAGDLWRSILFGLGVEFSDIRDDDARLSVLRVARGERPDRNGLLVIADNAETLSEALLEDLRRLTVQRHEGRPIVQVVLCGTYELEEQLALPELQTFSRRIGQHIVLEPLSREQSRNYLAHRLESAGGAVADVFTDEALDAISAAADGNLYCVNQLADHSLLLGFTNEERPVSAATVAAALEDLKGLPLPWNIPVASESAAPATEYGSDAAVEGTAAPTAQSDDDRHSWWDAEGDAAAIEVGADRSSSPVTPSLADGSPMTPPFESANVSAHQEDQHAPEVAELAVDDPYAVLDRLAEQGQAAPAFQPPVVNRPAPAPAPPEPAHTQRRQERLRNSHSGGMETKLLLDVTALRNEIRAGSEQVSESVAAPPPAPRVLEMAPTQSDWDIVEPEIETVPAMSWSEQALADLDGKFARTEPMLSMNAGVRPSTDASENLRTDATPQRRYARLFTRLRERRAATEQETASWPLRLWR
jgi:type II secretory pathway predicted ATPase ExeA